MTIQSELKQTASPSTPRLLMIVLVLSALATFVVLMPELTDRYRVVGDVRNMYRMARFQDLALFVNDPQGAFGAVEVSLLGRSLVIYPRSLGYGFLFWAWSFVADYVWLIKGLPLLLMPLSVFYLFRFGQLRGDHRTGFTLSLLFIFVMLASYQSVSVASGLQRGFAIPLAIIFLYYLANQQLWAAGLALIINALIYLPNVPILGLTYALTLLSVKPPSLNRAKLWPMLTAFALSGLIIAFALAVEFKIVTFAAPDSPLPPTEQPSVLQSEDLLQHSQGFAEMFFAFPFLGRAGILDTGTDVVNMLVLGIFAFFIYRIVGSSSLHKMPPEFKPLIVASLIMYILSMIAIFGFSSLALYLPSRYTRVTIFLLALFYVGLNWLELVEKAPRWGRQKAPLLIFFVIALTLTLGLVYFIVPGQLPLIPLLWFVGIISAGLGTVAGGGYLYWLLESPHSWPSGIKNFVAVTVALGVLGVGGWYIDTLGLRTINPTQPEREVYEFLASLPKDVLLVGEPEFMAGVPLYSNRSALFSALHPDLNAPILDYFDAYYAESPQPLLAFCQRYRVDYLIAKTSQFTPAYVAGGDFIFEPYNQLVVDMVTDRTDFVVPQLQPVFTAASYRVIPCNVETLMATQ